MTKNESPGKFFLFIYGNGFDPRGSFKLSNGNWFGKTWIIFGVDEKVHQYISISVHVDNKIKDILVLDKGQTDGLNNTAMTEEAKYSTNFTVQRNKLCLSEHFNRSTSFLFVNKIKID